MIAGAGGDLGARFNGDSPVYVLLEPGMVIHNSRATFREDEVQAILEMYQPQPPRQRQRGATEYTRGAC